MSEITDQDVENIVELIKLRQLMKAQREQLREREKTLTREILQLNSKHLAKKFGCTARFVYSLQSSVDRNVPNITRDLQSRQAGYVGTGL